VKPRKTFEPGAAARAERITALVEELDWGALSNRLRRFAFLRMKKRSEEEADEVAQTAIMQVLDPRYMAWDPDREPEIYDHLKNLVRGLVSNRRRRNEENRVVATDDDALVELAKAPHHDPATVLADKQLARTVADRFAAMFPDDAIVLEVVSLTAQGVVTPRDQAEAAGVPYDDVRNARRRMFRAAKEIAGELGLNIEDDDVD
jgi:DNA-directed RNA polymerase specialized sigma24 family protein